MLVHITVERKEFTNFVAFVFGRAVFVQKLRVIDVVLVEIVIVQVHVKLSIKECAQYVLVKLN